MSILGALLVYSSCCLCSNDPSACFARVFVNIIEWTTPVGCTTNCVPCIKFSDGTTECPPEKGAIDLTKSFSGLGVTVTGPPSLKVGEAGTWTAAAVNGIEPFTYYFYWGDKSNTESTANAAQHSYSKAGNYNVVVRVDETVSGNDALSSALPVEVISLPYTSCSCILEVNVTAKKDDSTSDPYVMRYSFYSDGEFTGNSYTGFIQEEQCQGPFQISIAENLRSYNLYTYRSCTDSSQYYSQLTASGEMQFEEKVDYLYGGSYIEGEVRGSGVCSQIQLINADTNYEYNLHSCDADSRILITCGAKK